MHLVMPNTKRKLSENIGCTRLLRVCPFVRTVPPTNRLTPTVSVGGVKDDSMLPTRSRDEHSGVRHMKRNSSLVTTARLGMPPDFYPPAG